MTDKINYLRVSVTSSCNENCWYCFNEGLAKTPIFMEDVEGFSWLIGQMRNHYGTEIVRFTGGEPLLNARLFEFVDVVHSHGITNIGLTTNGILMEHHKDEILSSKIKRIAVHICQIEKAEVNMSEVFSFVERTRTIFNNVRFNVVATRANVKYVEMLLDYAVQNNVNILLLDLLKSNMSMRQFAGNYVHLGEFSDKLIRMGLTAFNENENSTIYGNSLMSIKIVQHYSDNSTQCSYCTKHLMNNPLLISSNFEFNGCTHFKREVYSSEDAIAMKDERLLHERIVKLYANLEGCNVCTHKKILQDLKG